MAAEVFRPRKVDSVLLFSPQPAWFLDNAPHALAFARARGPQLGMHPASCAVIAHALALGQAHCPGRSAHPEEGGGPSGSDTNWLTVRERAWQHVSMELEPYGAMYLRFVQGGGATSVESSLPPPTSGSGRDTAPPSSPGRGKPDSRAGRGGVAAEGAKLAEEETKAPPQRRPAHPSPAAAASRDGLAAAIDQAAAAAVAAGAPVARIPKAGVGTTRTGSQTVFYTVELEVDGLVVCSAARRFSDFLVMHTRLKNTLGGASLPPPPPRYNKFTVNHTTPVFIQRRQRELALFMQRLVVVPKAMSHPALQGFVGMATMPAAPGAAPRHATHAGTAAPPAARAHPAPQRGASSRSDLSAASTASAESGSATDRDPLAGAAVVHRSATPTAAMTATAVAAPVPAPLLPQRSDYSVTFGPGSLGLQLTPAMGHEFAVVVQGVTPTGQAARHGVHKGHYFVKLNDDSLAGLPYDVAVLMLKTTGRPATITFRAPSGDVPRRVPAPPAPPRASYPAAGASAVGPARASVPSTNPFDDDDDDDDADTTVGAAHAAVRSTNPFDDDDDDDDGDDAEATVGPARPPVRSTNPFDDDDDDDNEEETGAGAGGPPMPPPPGGDPLSGLSAAGAMQPPRAVAAPPASSPVVIDTPPPSYDESIRHSGKSATEAGGQAAMGPEASSGGSGTGPVVVEGAEGQEDGSTDAAGDGSHRVLQVAMAAPSLFDDYGAEAEALGLEGDMSDILHHATAASAPGLFDDVDDSDAGLGLGLGLGLEHDAAQAAAAAAVAPGLGLGLTDGEHAGEGAD